MTVTETADKVKELKSKNMCDDEIYGILSEEMNIGEAINRRLTTLAKELKINTVINFRISADSRTLLAEDIETILNLINKQKEIEIYKHLYNKLQKDFESYKNDKDINYLDWIHHRKLVEKSIGQIIDKPEECWFDAVEVKIIRNNILYSINIEKDFISLKEISDEKPNECITVIAESPLSGAIYRYNNYGNGEWQLIGTMLGYA